MRLAHAMRNALLVLSLSLLVAQTAIATTRVNRTGPPCRDRIQSICDAVLIKDPVQREIELSHAIDEGLWSVDETTCKNSFFFLAEHSHELDPRRFRDAIKHFDKLDGYDRGAMLIEEADLYYSARSVRKRVYAQAISEGEVMLGKVRKLPRDQAVELAAREGFGELRQLIENYFPRGTDDGRALAGYLPWAKVDVLLELYDGAENDQDGNRRAVEKLRAMDVDVLAGKLERSDSYRGVVDEVAEMACRESASGECKALKAVLEKQMGFLQTELERHPVMGSGGARSGEQLSLTKPKRTEWLRDRMQDLP